jgi:hypothetical protein
MNSISGYTADGYALALLSAGLSRAGVRPAD